MTDGSAGLASLTGRTSDGRFTCPVRAKAATDTIRRNHGLLHCASKARGHGRGVVAMLVEPERDRLAQAQRPLRGERARQQSLGSGGGDRDVPPLFGQAPEVDPQASPATRARPASTGPEASLRRRGPPIVATTSGGNPLNSSATVVRGRKGRGRSAWAASGWA